MATQASDRRMKTIDLRGATYEEFIDFVFDRPVNPVTDGRTRPSGWYWEIEILFDPSAFAAFYIRLFTEPAELLAKFTGEQLEQGFWVLQCSGIEWGVSDLIWSQELPFQVRASIVRSMFELFAKLFAVNPLDTSPGMWWDSIAYDWHCNIRARANGGEDLLMQDVMFETLQKILHLRPRHVRMAALHGLGHLHHPNTQPVIDDWLRKQGDTDTELVEYAHAAAAFSVL